jgi:hypothetical protein
MCTPLRMSSHINPHYLRRKKCDEVQPRCLRCVIVPPNLPCSFLFIPERSVRCVNSGMECQYEYIPYASGRTKTRTKPAPRPPSERAKKTAKQQPNLTPVSQHMDPLQLGTLNTESFDPYSVPSLDAALLDTDWTAAFHELVRMPLLNNPIQSHVSACMVSRQPTGPPQHLMANQTSPSITLYCPENADSFLHLDPLTHVLVYSLPSSDENLDSGSPRPFRPIFRSPLDLTSDLHLSQNENLDDLEGVGKILCRAPVGLDRMVDSNSLMFVLYACEFRLLLHCKALTHPS